MTRSVTPHARCRTRGMSLPSEDRCHFCSLQTFRLGFLYNAGVDRRIPTSICAPGAAIVIETMKRVLMQQFEATLCTLHLCIEQCPADGWNAPVGNLKFCQVAFHTLFFTDYYLGRNPNALRDQPFHRANQGAFRDYEELQPRQQQLLYEKPFINAYLQHCRHKAAEVLAAETEQVLSAPCEFPPKTFSRAELHVYNLRHIQHHAAQLSLRLRLDHGVSIPWVGSGWRHE